MTVYIPKLHKSKPLPSTLPPSLPPHHHPLSYCPPAIHAKEHAGTKKLVSNALALNLVTQLYRLGAIEAARAPGTKKPANEVCLTSLNPLVRLFSERSN